MDCVPVCRMWWCTVTVYLSVECGDALWTVYLSVECSGALWTVYLSVECGGAL